MQDRQGRARGHRVLKDAVATGQGPLSKTRTGFFVMVLTVLAGLGQPASIPRAWAQTPPAAFDLIGDQTPVSLSGILPAHDPSVGKVAGSGGVSGGSATYEIPIVVPPGRRGMQPGLSLGYSSRAGNGIAGMGWSLSGLSSLHPCIAVRRRWSRTARSARCSWIPTTGCAWMASD